MAGQEVAGIVEYDRFIGHGPDATEGETFVETRDRDFPGRKAVRSYAEDGETRPVPVDGTWLVRRNGRHAPGGSPTSWAPRVRSASGLAHRTLRDQHVARRRWVRLRQLGTLEHGIQTGRFKAHDFAQSVLEAAITSGAQLHDPRAVVLDARSPLAGRRTGHMTMDVERFQVCHQASVTQGQQGLLMPRRFEIWINGAFPRGSTRGQDARQQTRIDGRAEVRAGIDPVDGRPGCL